MTHSERAKRWLESNGLAQGRSDWAHDRDRASLAAEFAAVENALIDLLGLGAPASFIEGTVAAIAFGAGGARAGGDVRSVLVAFNPKRAFVTVLLSAGDGGSVYAKTREAVRRELDRALPPYLACGVWS